MTWSTKPPTAVGGWFRSSLVELDSLQSFRGGIFHWKNRKFRLLPFVSEAGSEQSPNCPLGVFENCGRANGVGWTEGSPNCRWGFFKTQSILEFIHSFSPWWYRPDLFSRLLPRGGTDLFVPFFNLFTTSENKQKTTPAA